jgi:hypothetical protein
MPRLLSEVIHTLPKQHHALLIARGNRLTPAGEAQLKKRTFKQKDLLAHVLKRAGTSVTTRVRGENGQMVKKNRKIWRKPKRTFY